MNIEIIDGRPVVKCPHCGEYTPWDSNICVKCGQLVGRESHGTDEGQKDS